MTEIDRKKSVIRRYFAEIWSQGRLGTVLELMAPGYRNHDPSTPGRTVDRAGFQALVGGFRASFPDLTFEVVDMIVEGDRVVTHWVARATHRGEAFFGLPPTGKGASVEGFTKSRFEGELIAEDTAVWDTLGLLRALGAVPSP